MYKWIIFGIIARVIVLNKINFSQRIKTDSVQSARVEELKMESGGRHEVSKRVLRHFMN